MSIDQLFQQAVALIGAGDVPALERLREVLSAEPERAKASGDGGTPLMWLPGDEARAKEIVDLFLAHGADPTVRNKDGQVAADLARKRGLDEVANLLSR